MLQIVMRVTESKTSPRHLNFLKQLKKTTEVLPLLRVLVLDTSGQGTQRKQDDSYPIPSRTQHFYQPVPNTNPYPIPTRTIYLAHVMAFNAWFSGRARAGRVQQTGLLKSPAVVTPRGPMTSPYTNSYHISNTEHPQLVPCI